jgi:hypothetical protein
MALDLEEAVLEDPAGTVLVPVAVDLEDLEGIYQVQNQPEAVLNWIYCQSEVPVASKDPSLVLNYHQLHRSCIIYSIN